MKELSSPDLIQVSGAGYYEDITTAAATIYVGTYISGLTAGVAELMFGALAAYAPTAELAYVGLTVGTFTSQGLIAMGPLLAYGAFSAGGVMHQILHPSN